jgi:hypothetical protein
LFGIGLISHNLVTLFFFTEVEKDDTVWHIFYPLRKEESQKKIFLTFRWKEPERHVLKTTFGLEALDSFLTTFIYIKLFKNFLASKSCKLSANLKHSTLHTRFAAWYICIPKIPILLLFWSA